MKVPLHVVHARREKLALLLQQHRYLPIQELCRRLGVSEATARRDLAALVREKKITRTYGGALHEFNDRFPSFRERQGEGARAKRKIAQAAQALFELGRTYFFDSGTTVFAIAEAFRERPVTPATIVTSNLPVGEALAAIPEVQVFQLAGQLLHLQSTLLGETAQKSLEFWSFDLAFLSAEGMTAEGIWNSQAAIVEQQRVVLRRSARSVLCLDGAKLGRQPPFLLVEWPQVDLLLTDLPLERLRKAGIPVEERQYFTAAARGARAKGAPRMGPVGEPPGDQDLPVHFL